MHSSFKLNSHSLVTPQYIGVILSEERERELLAGNTAPLVIVNVGNKLESISCCRPTPYLLNRYLHTVIGESDPLFKGATLVLMADNNSHPLRPPRSKIT